MHTIGHILKNIREDKGIALQDVQLASQINYSLLSRIENGERLPTLEQIEKLASIYNFDQKRLLLEFESDKIIKSIQHSELAEETLKVAKNKILYGDRYISVFQNDIYSKPISLESRRYIGNKTKLADWIFNIIEKECPNVQSFCDIFAGTGTISKQALKRYDKVIINDFLYSNNVIYKAFFGEGFWNKEKLVEIINSYNLLNPNDLQENYFSENFGGKYYTHSTAKQIGYVRQNIEDLRPQLTEKEHSILLATLIYNIDRIANTVGHFDAYIKKEIKEKPLQLRLIEAESFKNVEIFREDANVLVQNISPDLVYIDPPYNSRQYASAYHLLENLAQWQKPSLQGVAMKPNNLVKSEYCTNKALQVFSQLVKKLKTKYIALSYNNMAKKGNGRSNAKMSDEEILQVLSKKGEVQIFSHPHKAFSTGKTNIKDNEERLFLCKVK